MAKVKQGKKILHVVSISFSLRYFVGDQFHYFKNLGSNIHVACSDSPEFHALSKEFGFTAYPLPVNRKVSPLQDIVSIYKLWVYIKEENFDIVVAHSPKGGLIGMIAAYFARSPKRVFVRHGLVFETAVGLKKKLLIMIERVIGYCAHKVVNVSPSLMKASRIFDLNPEYKDIIIGKGSCNGIDTNRFIHRPRSESKTFTFGFIGRLTRDKGIIELIKAWKVVQVSVNEPVKLLLVGPIDDREPLPNDVMHEITQNTSIDYLGEVSDTSVYYNKMDVFLLPSYREGFPTVNLEASSSSLPVITTKFTGCIDSIIENRTGIFTSINVDDISDKILYYINNKELAKIHGQNGRQFVLSNFSQPMFYHNLSREVYDL